MVGLSKEQDELWRTGRYAHVLVNMGGVPLHVINLYCLKKGVHYEGVIPGDELIWRTAEVVTGIGDVPVVVLGDFNRGQACPVLGPEPELDKK